MGSSFARNLDAFLTLKQLSQESFARAIGKSQGAVSHWLSGNREPASTTLSRICEVYGYSRDDFVSSSNGFYAKLHGLSSETVPFKPTSVMVPLLGTTHMGEFADEDECDRVVEIPAHVAEAHPDGFCVHADGSCMDNRYPSDSVLFVDPRMQPFDGCAVLAETEQRQSIVRKYAMGSTSLMLSPDSHSGEFEDIIVKADDAPVMLKGVVVWYQAEKDVR